MAIESEVVKHVATLARLNITSEELTTYTEQLSNILGIMDQLDQVPTDGVEPMSHAVDVQIPERDDVVTNTNNQSAMLANAPDSEEGHFRVPKIIE
ncbi:MAG: Asp-tRNA(Asn)/Glu-tRNA(Gln) amidotransferase subunit GatC [Magnetococcales bacterium]|nr:Asp-tRNA(Asn)/Glu-tRNA(Gln) amidotransferase subunit GatC [Magnetococcales bacterium]